MFKITWARHWLSLPLTALFGVTLCLAMPQKAHALACSASITDVDFGTPNLLSSSTTDALATVTVTCTGVSFLTVVKMCPSIGEGSGGAIGAGRLMSGPGSGTLTYQLYQDASRTQAWGAIDNPEIGTVPVITLTGNLGGGVTATRTVYARLFGSQSNSPPGNYESEFVGTEVALSYSSYFLTSSGSCTGFIGSSVIRPAFDVVASPPAGCTLSVADLSFPAVGVLASALAGQTSLKVTCTRPTAYAISLDNGRTGTSPTARKMTSAAGAAVTYGLYRDAARTLIWGSTTGQTVKATGSGTEQKFDIFGSIPIQATPAPAIYSDRIIVTLTY